MTIPKTITSFVYAYNIAVTSNILLDCTIQRTIHTQHTQEQIRMKKTAVTILFLTNCLQTTTIIYTTVLLA